MGLTCGFTGLHGESWSDAQQGIRIPEIARVAVGAHVQEVERVAGERRAKPPIRIAVVRARSTSTRTYAKSLSRTPRI